MEMVKEAQRSVLLIDLDGTLLESAADLTAALNQLRAEFSRPALTVAQVENMVGDGIPKLVERGLTNGGEPLPTDRSLEDCIARFLVLYDDCLADHTRPYPGVSATLAVLKQSGWRLAVCTNKAEAASHKILQILELDHYFETVAGGDSFEERKPAAAFLRNTMARLGLPIEQAIMVGDSGTDLQTARNAGIPVILVSYGYSREPVRALDPDGVVDRFADLPDVLRGLT